MRAAALVLGLGFLTVGCGGGSERAGAKSAADSAPVAESGSSGGFASAAPASPEPSEAKSSQHSAPPPASPTGAAPSTASRKDSSAAEASRAPRPTERPGLGTEWGETRRSRIREVGFDRQSDDPTAVVSLNYNDREGARALASFHDARPVPSNSFTALGGAIRVALEGDGGSLQSFRVGDRSVVVGTAGQRYTIVLTNRTGRRFETVASVDGLDVISGRPASFDQRGYVLLPFATLRIEGFRQSEHAVAAFRFSRVADSYAAQTGSARNVGVIGIAFFRERGDSGIDDNELELRDSATPFPAEPGRFARPPR